MGADWQPTPAWRHRPVSERRRQNPPQPQNWCERSSALPVGAHSRLHFPPPLRWRLEGGGWTLLHMRSHDGAFKDLGFWAAADEDYEAPWEHGAAGTQAHTHACTHIHTRTLLFYPPQFSATLPSVCTATHPKCLVNISKARYESRSSCLSLTLFCKIKVIFLKILTKYNCRCFHWLLRLT